MTPTAESGRKFDQGKDQWSLLPWAQVRDVVRVLTYGAAKYAPDNWQSVADARTRYFSAAHRHLAAWFGGERNDPETQLPHLAHAICCLLFLGWHDK